jgi:phosphomannomutase
MDFNPEIFKAYDIRGVYGKDFNAGLAFQLGGAFVRYLNRKKFLVARDGRDFSQTLAGSLIEGITSAGGDVENLGLASLPFFYFVLDKLGVDGGVMVTASHNPPEYGGFKLFRGDGSQIYSKNGLKAVEQLLAEGGEVSRYGGRIGKNQAAGLKRKYIEYAEKRSGISPAGIKGLKVKIKGEGVGAEEARTLLGSIGVSCDEIQFDIAFSFDGDADRLIVLNGAGEQILPDFILGLIVKDKRGFFSKPKVVHALNFSKGVLEKFEEWGIKTYESKVGRPHIRELMVKHRADYGGELSGHILFKDNNYCELPLAAVLMILKILARTDKNINQLVEEFKSWFNSGEINIESENPEKNMADLTPLLKEKYADGKLKELDGLTVEYPDWWFNLRPSNTEPFLRLVIEAKTKDLLDEKIRETTEMIKAAK